MMKENFILKVNNILENEDGTATVLFDVDDEFKSWFKKREGLTRWSNKRFQKVISKAICKYAESIIKSKE